MTSFGFIFLYIPSFVGIYILSFGCTGSSLLLGLSLVVVSRGYTVAVVVVCGLLPAVASLGADQGL